MRSVQGWGAAGAVEGSPPRPLQFPTFWLPPCALPGREDWRLPGTQGPSRSLRPPPLGSIVSRVQSGEHHVLTAFFLSVICSSFPFLIHPHHLYSRPSIWVTPTKFLSFIQSVDVIAILLGARHQLILPTPVSPFSRISSWPESTISLNYYFYHISTEHFSSPLIPTTSSLNYLVHLSKTSNIPTLPYPPLFPTTPNTNHPLQSGCSTLSPRKIAWL